MEQTIPRGLCQCGCGQRTNIAQATKRRNGYVKGEPVPYAVGHNGKRRPPLIVAPLCACGCGQTLPIARYPSQQAKYIRGHRPNANVQRDRIIQRFWARVEKSLDGCWLWTGSVRHFGHGHLNVNRQRVLAHRFSWELAHGEIPSGTQVNHHCDNPRCVRPDHLYLGTQAENIRDMFIRHRDCWSTGGRKRVRVAA